MNLKVLLPFQIFAAETDVTRIVAETPDGSFGILPLRLDCVAALVPGILTYETEADGEVFVAVDEGVMVKTGADVLVSVRRALAGTDLGQLRDAVEQEFMTLDEHEQIELLRKPGIVVEPGPGAVLAIHIGSFLHLCYGNAAPKHRPILPVEVPAHQIFTPRAGIVAIPDRRP